MAIVLLMTLLLCDYVHHRKSYEILKIFPFLIVALIFMQVVKTVALGHLMIRNTAAVNPGQSTYNFLLLSK